jgi:RND family efflux transporter MFP subunit
VAPKTTGQLEWLGVEEGSRVTSGQVLARLENRDVKAARDQASAALLSARFNLEQARAELTDASRAFKRAQELVASGVVSQSDFDTAETRLDRAKASVSSLEAGVKSAKATLAGADAAVGYTVIRAPFDAVVLTKNADIGDIVTPIGAAANAKAAVVSIADLGSLRVEADVSESNLGKVKQGQPCEIQLDALPDLRFRGAVHTIVPTADRSKASVMVKVSFIDRDPRILPEMSAKVAFLERQVAETEQKPKIAVTQAAVRNKDGKQVVYLVKGDRLAETMVTLGAKIGDQVEILSGVRPGDKVAVKPVEKLKNGVKIRSAEK